MKCKVCGSNNITVSYHGQIRNGGLGQYTDTDVDVYKCSDCGVLWHEPI